MEDLQVLFLMGLRGQGLQFCDENKNREDL